MGYTKSVDEKYCVTCRHWGGQRQLTWEKRVDFEANQAQGHCYSPKRSSYVHQTIAAVNSCPHWEQQFSK